MAIEITALDHIQLAMPAGLEADARYFYSDLLGLKEVTKPALLAVRGGVWFAGPDIAVHLGVEGSFRAAHKAHPCFRVADIEAAWQILDNAGVPLTPDDALPGVHRFYAADPFGNRIEFLQQGERLGE